MEILRQFFTYSVCDNEFYNMLEVEPPASVAEISKKYKQIALKRHPDKGGHGQYEDNFAVMTRAYNTLKDPKTRRVYDVQGMDGLQNMEANRKLTTKIFEAIKFGIYDFNPIFKLLCILIIFSFTCFVLSLFQLHLRIDQFETIISPNQDPVITIIGEINDSAIYPVSNEQNIPMDNFNLNLESNNKTESVVTSTNERNFLSLIEEDICLYNVETTNIEDHVFQIRSEIGFVAKIPNWDLTDNDVSSKHKSTSVNSGNENNFLTMRSLQSRQLDQANRPGIEKYKEEIKTIESLSSSNYHYLISFAHEFQQLTDKQKMILKSLMPKILYNITNPEQ